MTATDWCSDTSGDKPSQKTTDGLARAQARRSRPNEAAGAPISSLLEQIRLIHTQRNKGQLRPWKAGCTETLPEMVLPAIQQTLQTLTHGR